MTGVLTDNPDVAATATTQEESLTLKAAADFLNVDRSYLVHLLDGGIIPATGRGRRRRIYREDLDAYKRRRDAERRLYLRELTHLSEEAGMDDVDYAAIIARES